MDTEGPDPLGTPEPLGKGEQTRRAILDAAIERFGRNGFRSTSVAEIAREAGVGGTVTYAYFANKEALFEAALDEDAAAVISEGVTAILEDPIGEEWRQTLILTLVDAVERHPLARRVMAGLEPHVTDRMLELPALAELRKAVADRLRTDQLAGLVRHDIDPESVGNGAVTIVISLMMSVLQFGGDRTRPHSRDVLAVFEAAIDPLPAPSTRRTDRPDP